jgi:hypothetical protein
MHVSSKGLAERFDCEAASQARRLNAGQLIEVVRGLRGVELAFPRLDAGVVPMALPVLVADPSRVQAALLASGVEAMHLWPAPAGLPAREAAVMRPLHDRLLCLPIRDPYTPDDMEQVARALASAVGPAREHAEHTRRRATS